jgi:hypothetical protein
LGSSLVVAILDECGPMTKVIVDFKKLTNKSIYTSITYGCDNDCLCHLRIGIGHGCGKGGSKGNGSGEGKGTGYEIEMYRIG